jgi:7-cyano-7-deazaguanine synthase in queuosine biosynthesis
MSHEVILAGGPVSGAVNRSFHATLGAHIRINPEPIARHTLLSLAAVSEDVATIAEASALADRLITRHRADGWSRRIELQVPVFEQSAFSGGVLDALIDTLGFLTGDSWHFEMVKRSAGTRSTGYLPLCEENPEYVVPFSNGLDSFAQAKLLENEHGVGAVARVRAGVLQGSSEASPPISVPRRFFSNRHPRELTYRTRPFVYYSIAAIAAATLDAKAMVLGESGQGAIGPSFARFGNEWPFRSAHPGFTKRLERYFTLVFAKPIHIQQPQIWKTKGEVLAELAEANAQEGWSETTSCSARPLQRYGEKGCGVCGGCLLRRVSSEAAGLLPIERTAFDPASLELLRISSGATAPLSDNETEILVRSALSMEHFANVALSSDDGGQISRELLDLPGDSRGNMAAIRRLSAKHAVEWQSMLERLPELAWLRQHFVAQ